MRTTDARATLLQNAIILFWQLASCNILAQSKKSGKKHCTPLSIRRRCTLIARAEAHYTCTSQHSKYLLHSCHDSLLDHARAQERDDAKEAHQKDEKHGLLITKKDAKAKPPCPPTKNSEHKHSSSTRCGTA